MTAMAQESQPTQEELFLESFLALETPEGSKAEFIDGEIVVTPPPDGEHEDYFSTLVRHVLRHSVNEMDIAGTKGLILPGSERTQHLRVIPDATFAPRELRLFRGAPTWMPPQGVAMVAEVTSTNPQRDRVAKRHAYARAGIPLYLLIDRERATAILHSEPSDGDHDDYAVTRVAPFGKPLPLPEPFEFELDTGELL